MNKEKLKRGEVFIHIEHQTKRDKTINYRIAEYQEQIKRKAMKDNKAGLIPKVYSIVIYSGTEEWNIANDKAETEGALKAEISEENRYEIIERKNLPYKAGSIIALALRLENITEVEAIKKELSKVDISNLSKESKDLLIQYLRSVILQSTEEGIDKIKEIMKGDKINMLHLAQVILKEKEEQFNKGKEVGFNDGKAVGFNDGKAAGFNDGKAVGFNDGKAAGFNDGKIVGFNDGKKSGIKEGMRKNKIQIAKKMMREKIDIELICKITGLGRNEIKKF